MKFPNSIWTPVMSKQGTWIFRGKHNGNPCSGIVIRTCEEDTLVIINQDNATMINITPAEEYLEGMYYGPIPEPPEQPPKQADDYMKYRIRCLPRWARAWMEFNDINEDEQLNQDDQIHILEFTLDDQEIEYYACYALYHTSDLHDTYHFTLCKYIKYPYELDDEIRETTKVVNSGQRLSKIEIAEELVELWHGWLDNNLCHIMRPSDYNPLMMLDVSAEQDALHISVGNSLATINDIKTLVELRDLIYNSIVMIHDNNNS